MARVTKKKAVAAPAPRSREASKQDTRVALIRAGMDLFGERGLDAPSLDEICERAGYTRGAFYVHFADRDSFLVAVMDRVGVDFLDAVLGSGDGPEDLGVTIERFVTAVAQGDYPLTREGGVRPHQLLDACARSPAIRERYRALVTDSLTRLHRAIGGGQRGGTVRADLDADPVAAVLMAAVIGAQTMIDLGVQLDLASAGGALISMLAPAKRGYTPPRGRR